MTNSENISPPKIGGFLNKDGNLRSAQEISSENARLEEKRSEASNSSPSPQSDDIVALSREAFNKVTDRTRSQVNEAAQVLNESKARLKETKQNLKAQDELLAKYQDSTDPEEREKIKADFAVLQERQSQLAAESEAANRRAAERGSVRIQVGNQQIGSVRPIEEPVVKAREVDFEDKKSIKAARNDLDTAKSEINEALKAEKSKIQELRELSSSAFENIATIKKATSPSETSAPLSSQGADELASSVRNAVLSQGAQSLNAFNPSAATQRILDALR